MIAEACQMPLQPNWPKVPVFGGMYGNPIGRVDVERAEDDHRDHDADLDRHDDGVDDRRFLDALVAERRRGSTIRIAGRLKMAPVAVYIEPVVGGKWRAGQRLGQMDVE